MLIPCFIPIKKRVEHEFMSKSTTVSIKGISAIFVMVAHYQIWIDQLQDIKTNRLIHLTIGELGGIGVLLFFFVSGYGIHKSYSDKEVTYKFLLKRITTLYIPYIIMKFLLLPWRYGAGITSRSLFQEIVDILLIRDWFIFVIMLLYVIFYVASKISKKHIIVQSLVADILLTYIFIIQNKPFRWFNALWLFTFGMILSKKSEDVNRIINKRGAVVNSICTIAFFICGITFSLFKSNLYMSGFKIIAGSFLCIIVISFFNSYKIDNRFIYFVGKRSLHLYIIHITIWECLQNLKNVGGRLIFAIVITFIVTELIYRITSMISKTLNSIVKY